MAIPARTFDEIRRLMTRLAIARTLGGWKPTALSRRTGLSVPTIPRLENGEIRNPTLGTLITVAEPLGLRVDLVAEHHAPLLELSRSEVEALIEAAAHGWRQMPRGLSVERQTLSALRKLGKIKKQEASPHV